MVKKRSLLILGCVFFLVFFSESLAAELPGGIYAEMETNKGRILFRLFYEQAPMTVANFVGLAEGKKEWRDPDNQEVKRTPFYNSLTFHRVIPNQMVQGGDPKGNGHGGPGYNFQHEFHPALRHDHAGVLSMLNKGPYTHGSQFLITLRATPFLDGKHTVFGEVMKGLNVVKNLKERDRVIRVSILRRDKAAQMFDLAYYLDRVRSSAEQVAIQEKRQAQENARKPVGLENKKNLPELKGEIDPARVPGRYQPESHEIALEYLLITYKGARSPIEFPYYDEEGARQVAQHLVTLARVKGADFEKLASEFSDSPEYKISVLKKSKKLPGTIELVFRLGEGQVSDPIEAPEGFYVFKRVKLELITVRHILISYQGVAGSAQTRTKEEARDLAENVLRRARAGEDFATLAQKYSDSASAKDGGLIGEIARGTIIPVFEQAAFSLKENEISDIIPVPIGFQIIKRCQEGGS
jgi:cyclophilin family peptidyl-prolyl cis-trans isomerase